MLFSKKHTLWVTAWSESESLLVNNVFPKCKDGVTCTIGALVGSPEKNFYTVSHRDYKMINKLLK